MDLGHHPPVRYRNHDAEVAIVARTERGTGLIGTAAASAAFILLMLFAVQLTVHLYATSTINAAGYDAARLVASRTVDHSDPAAVTRAQVEAEARFRDLVGDAGRDARFAWSHDGHEVTLQVVVDGPRILPGALRENTGLGEIERTFQVRVERER